MRDGHTHSRAENSGQGFISAARKRYASHWEHMSHPYPPALVAWLVPRRDLDFLHT